MPKRPAQKPKGMGFIMKENNFTKAVKELLGEKEGEINDDKGYLSDEQPIRSANPIRAEEPVFKNSEFRPEYKEREFKERDFKEREFRERDVKERESFRQEPVPEFKAEFKPEVPVVTYAETYINSATIINGSISAKSDIVIEGRVTGDIVTENNISVTGKVDGNIDGNFVSINGGYVIGNINAKSKVTTDATSVVVGDISADSFSSDGKVKGNLKIITAVSLSNNAVVFGNVSSKGISIQDGAVVKGNLQVLSPTIDNDDVFTYAPNMDI